MKKLLIAILLLTTIVMSFASCTNSNTDQTNGDDIIDNNTKPIVEDSTQKTNDNDGNQAIETVAFKIYDYDNFLEYLKTGVYDTTDVYSYGGDPTFFTLIDSVRGIDVKEMFDLPKISDKANEQIIIENNGGFRYNVYDSESETGYTVSVEYNSQGTNSLNIDNSSNVTIANINFGDITSKEDGIYNVIKNKYTVSYVKYKNLYNKGIIYAGNLKFVIDFSGSDPKNAAEIRSRCGDKIASLFSGDAKLAEATMSEIVNDLK